MLVTVGLSGLQAEKEPYKFRDFVLFHLLT